MQLEEEVKQLNLILEDAETCQKPERLQTVCSQVGLAENQIEQLYLRWEELDKKFREV